MADKRGHQHEDILGNKGRSPHGGVEKQNNITHPAGVEEILEWIDRISENSTKAGAEHDHEDELVPFPSASLNLNLTPDAGAGPRGLTTPQSTVAPSTPSLRIDTRRFGMVSPKDYKPPCGTWSENGQYKRDTSESA
ncbi:hypothetical protein GGTG_00840 [Gaeumannomyces tritici R3-111a-1]|uniref:Uncharacterized protein n=1 Tax=Gaeumannomyces tritici (strain R3-111a-1) TaxID=644352 RepID=J3NHV4_GAET3|nr:hypothetical protein GGTG_00840 [Gaeumannomyces tritici R3-111a-1]EJT80847.1 hypothetical protein GGTG_00840 [Gaeumannomyces tritici R3-111a-1]